MIRFALTIFACLFLHSICDAAYPNAVELRNKIFHKTLKTQLVPANHYALIGYGGYASRDVVKLVSGYFQYYGTRTQEQMEDMLINTVEMVLKAYNSNKEIRPLLVDYPMTKKHFHIVIGAYEATPEESDAIDTIFYAENSPYRLRYSHHDPITGKPTIMSGEFGDPYDVVKARRAAAHAAHANAAADLSTYSVDHPKGAGSS